VTGEYNPKPLDIILCALWTDRALTVVIRRFERGAITPQSFQLHKENLLRMVSYCENTHECRCIARETPARGMVALSHTHTHQRLP
jgi:hypothetical protein